MKQLFLLFALISTYVNALEFKDYCPYTSGEQDCSNEFKQALKDASSKKEAIILNKNEVFRIESINTTNDTFSDISILGSGNKDQLPIIFTDKLFLTNIPNFQLTNIKINGIHNEEGDEQQATTIVLIGGNSSETMINNITVSNVFFENSAEDLLAIFNATDVKVLNNTFSRSGLAMRIAEILIPGDLRPRGSGLVFDNIINATINYNQFYQIKKVGFYLASHNIISKNIYIMNNYFDIQNFEKPTYRYGLKGGTGVYLDQTLNFNNIHIKNNTFYNYKMNAMRINGSNIYVKDNNLNFLGTCNEPDDEFEAPLGGIAIKAHYLFDSEISNNCSHNNEVAIVLESMDEINNVLINKNKIFKPVSGIVTQYFDNKGTYKNIKIDRNEIYGSKKHAITFRSLNISENNTVTSNTISNNAVWMGEDTRFHGALVNLQNQENLYFDNNWILGHAYSQSWNFVSLFNVSNSTFIRSYIKGFTGKDTEYGGIYLDSDSDNNILNNITFDGLSPGLHNYGTSNEISNIDYK